MSEILVVPPNLQKETANLAEVCPVQAYVLAGVWWNMEATHYYKTTRGILCHAVVPQYNLHGNYVVGNLTTTPYHRTPSDCVNDSYTFDIYMYHGSVGYYSFYEDEVGTYCAKSKTADVAAKILGTFDINGSVLANDTGSNEIRHSYWYGVAGALWLVYRAFVIRRSFLLCKHYGRKCSELGEDLTYQQTMVFVQESLRLSAHGATNYQRSALLYLIAEGIMSDIFLTIAHDNWTMWIQYISLGYNLSGLVLRLFEMVESMKWLSEKWRQRLKRVFFSYEATLVGELNYQRSAMLYLIVEGVMTDLFLIIANDGVASKVQYVSLGYNLSGLMLLLFEMVERMNSTSSHWRLGVKRLLFSYETALVGELVTALALQAFLSSLNASDLKRSKPTALAVSYYFWSLVCHGAVVLVIVSIISAVRTLCALLYLWLKHRSFSGFLGTVLR